MTCTGMILDILFHRISLAEALSGPFDWMDMDAVGCVRSDAIESPALRDAMRTCGRHEHGASADILINQTLIHIREGRGHMGRSS